eukprot:TRINITY_DN33733_c0_g1_i1.p1 TRINITY_DN33733_c0_g1~~TRINITY_DN33733_c0_g1_i1.p1  ORF type:complete len:501 (+),score=124.35 TRINITY_DN33733_c0_g1_i1:529-2031(+)
MASSEFVVIEPNELRFEFQVGKELLSKLSMRNICPYSVNVKVTASVRRRYGVSPANCRIAAGATAVVVVTCEAQKSRPMTLVASEYFTVDVVPDIPPGPGFSPSPNDKSLQKQRAKLLVVFGDRTNSPQRSSSGPSPSAASAASSRGIGGTLASAWRRESFPPPENLTRSASELDGQLAKARAVQEMMELKEQLEGAQRRAEAEENKSKTLQTELAALRLSAQNSSREGGPLKSIAEESPRSVPVSIGERRIYEERLKSLHKKVEELEGKVEAAEERAADANKRLVAEAKKARSLEGAQSTESVRKEAGDTDEKQRLMAKLRDAQHDVDDLSAQVTRMSPRLDAAVQRCKAVEKELEEEKRRTADMLEQLKEAGQREATMAKELATMTSLRDDGRDECARLRKELEEKRGLLKELKERNEDTELRDTVARLRVQLRTMTADMQGAASQMSQMQEEMDHMEEERRAAKADAARQLRELRADRDRLEAENERLVQVLGPAKR